VLEYRSRLLRARLRIDIPGPETDALAVIARDYNAYVMAQAKAHHPGTGPLGSSM